MEHVLTATTFSAESFTIANATSTPAGTASASAAAAAAAARLRSTVIIYCREATASPGLMPSITYSCMSLASRTIMVGTDVEWHGG